MKLPSLILSVATSLTLFAFAPETKAQTGLTQTDVAKLAASYSEGLIANREVLKNYSWQYRTEVWQSGQLLWVDLVNANLNAQGLPVYTQINREQIVDQKRGLFSKPKQGKNFEEVDRIINYVSDWVTWYNRMPLSRVTELFDQAARTNRLTHASPGGELLLVQGTNVRDSNARDTVNLWIHKGTVHPIQFGFTIPVEKSLDGATGETINATIHYRYLRNGEAFYPDHVEIKIPSREMMIKIENLNMLKKL